MSTTSFRILDFGFPIADFFFSFIFPGLSTKILNPHSEIANKKGHGRFTHGLCGNFDEQVVSDRQRQWASR